MKNFALLLITIFSLQLTSAQTLNDAYRYSSSELDGTARFVGMSGAFGALGGDMSAVSINPASSAVFLSSNFTGSMVYRNNDYSNSFNGGLDQNEDSNFDIGNLGGVFIFNNTDDSNWKKISLGLNFNTVNDYDESFSVRGNSNSSIDQYFLNFAQDVPLDLLQTQSGESIAELYQFLGENYGFGYQQALLGFQGYLIDVDPASSQNQYSSLIAPGNFDQSYSKYATGINGKLTFNVGTQYKENLYLGLNLNSHFINYESSFDFSEFNNNSGSETTEVYFGNSLAANGEGFSFQLGGITKFDNFRIGATYDSPIWFTIREETSEYLESNSSLDEYVVVAPNVINIYPEYTLRTPGQVTGSLAYLFGTTGLISFDYSLKDYSNTKFRPENDLDFQDLNAQISSEMKASSTYKLGAEYRISKVSLRGGYRYVESPYENETTIGNLTGYSAGLGYNFGNINIDLAYSNAEYDSQTPVFNTGLTTPIYAQKDLSKVILSVSFGL
ncbi:transporter [Gramella sp. AN32]|uniref:OmpP1/FadL family transporter n=1 Tax=Christiangramia antarctica TaxID=2058158 RepID=A0ABW5X7M9_9FLAO|nr:transporter [Gramella sp. AN32]MCM4155876.1 transporter [Gramella sp. AN32]